jgi:23S rRNA G2445 N2-methylase RlmL
VLDPECGSDSFPIKAFDRLHEYYIKSDKGKQALLDFKTGAIFNGEVQILLNNIFGVDLDKQAVEIAQLNLLLKITEKGQRLPILEQNVKIGNSLIYDEKVAGNKAFKWEQEFKEIIPANKFDDIIGNPPYGSCMHGTYNPKEKVVVNGQAITLAQYASRMNVKLLRPADFNDS